ncbi:uncharacterized protein BX663DRAFT_555471 [Cokeromyces recurvatus]|uniref:uncharacterized protein n=1 Tax=Cokeromyces recurvatus TaxID=90255 RepID=UPI00221FFD70|nr:uncharacterized protein BX663DRAFT_555471 [Cokeromyces recurvatus]KAI7898933.1 hypothetical protein BX663DRAFT_555471 [Cokeromyces recurvatus]
MKSTVLIALFTTLVLLNNFVKAHCDCDPNDSSCLFDCVNDTNQCIVDCEDDTDCYTSCIIHNWPGIGRHGGHGDSPSHGDKDSGNNDSNNNDPMSTTQPVADTTTTTNMNSPSTSWDIPPPPEWSSTLPNDASSSETTAPSSGNEPLWPIPSVFVNSFVPPNGLASSTASSTNVPSISSAVATSSDTTSATSENDSSSLMCSKFFIGLTMFITVYILQ